MNRQIKTEEIVQTLSEGLSRLRNRPITVLRIEREPYLESTSFPAERIRALVDDGKWIPVFFKDLNPDHLLAEAKSLREAGLDRSRREYLMYRDVLTRLPLHTPQLYGSRWEPESGICWLLLEDAGPYPLRQIGDFSLWIEAVRWAARLHAVHPEEIRKFSGFLPSYDAAHYTFCAERIARNLHIFNSRQTALAERVLALYQNGIQELLAMPRHLIHGEFFGKNIVIRPGRKEDAVAVTDWESAAFGPRCVDLVSITSGKWSNEQRDEMIRAYLEEAEKQSGRSIDRTAFEQEMSLTAIYRALWWVGYWSEAKEHAFEGWMNELELLMSAIPAEY